MLVAALVVAALVPLVSCVPCATTCTTDLDCSLNGACSGGACTCDPGWTGQCCGVLDLLPVDVNATHLGYRHPDTSTWGGNIITTDSGLSYHMWIAEMAPNGTDGDAGAGSCGLTTWGSNSQITHVKSTLGYGGPFEREEVAVPVWSHNPLVRQMPGPGAPLVMYHIGSGAGGPPRDGYCALNATSPCGEQSFDQCALPPNPCGIAVPGFSCHAGYCSGDPALGGDCGADVAEPSLSCNGSWASCVPAAAAACDANAACNSFGLSSVWPAQIPLRGTKLFSAGTAGLTANSQWATWVRAGHASSAAAEASAHLNPDLDMHARARLLGGPGVGLTDVVTPPPQAGAGCLLELHYAPGVGGPWVSYPNATITPCASNNPAPWVHPNGTIYVVFTDQNMGMWRAEQWQGPYTLVTTGVTAAGEDPSLYTNKRGWHCLFHRSPFSDPDIAIGHAYSLDGLMWQTADDAAANSTIDTVQFGRVVHGKRERPHLYFDASLNPAAFVTGVCITPECDPFAGTFNASADCSSATQYHHCDANSPGPGWYDRTYTLVQGIRGA